MLKFRSFVDQVLNEAIRLKDKTKALALIMSYLSKHIGKLHLLPYEEEFERDGNSYYAIRYITTDGRSMRFNWLHGNNSDEVSSIDFCTAEELTSMDSTGTLELNGESLARVLPAVVYLFKNPHQFNLSLNQYLNPAEPVTEGRTPGSLGKKTLDKLAAQGITVAQYMASKNVTKDNTPMHITSNQLAEDYEYADPKTIFRDLENMSRLVVNGQRPSLLVCGLPGLGKTFTVTELIKSLGKKKFDISQLDLQAIDDSEFDEDGEDDEDRVVERPVQDYDWVHVKGSASAWGLYNVLYQHNGKLIVFDDCDSIFKDAKAQNILKGALDSSDSREISWINANTLKGTSTVPAQFEFTGRVIFITNLYLRQINDALISRSLVCDIDMKRSDILLRIESILPHMDMSDRAKKMALEYLKQYADVYTHMQLTMRAAIMIGSFVDAIPPFSKTEIDSLVQTNLRALNIAGKMAAK